MGWFQVASTKCLRSDSGVGVGHLEVRPCIAAQDWDGDRDLLPPGSGAGAAPGHGPPAAAPAQSCAARTGLNTSAFQYFWSLSERSQPRLIGSSREETSCRKCPAILQPALPMGDVKASPRTAVSLSFYTEPPAVRHGRGSALTTPAARRAPAGQESPRRDLLPGASPSLSFPDIATCLHLRPFPEVTSPL